MTVLSSDYQIKQDVQITRAFSPAGDNGASSGLFGIGLPAAAGPRRSVVAVSLSAPPETPQPKGFAPTSRSEEETVPDPSRPQKRP